MTVSPPMSAPTSAAARSGRRSPRRSPFRICGEEAEDAERPRPRCRSRAGPRASSGSYCGRDRVAERRPAAVREVQREHDADDDPTTAATRNDVPIRPAFTSRASRTRTSATSTSSRMPSSTPQPIEPNSHSPRNRSATDQEQETRRSRRMPIATPDERDHPLDLVDDLAELGLREVDVGAEQALAGRERRAELGAQARRARPNRAGRRAAWPLSSSSTRRRPRHLRGFWDALDGSSGTSHARSSAGLRHRARVAARYPRRRWNRSARPSCCRSGPS